MTPLDPTRTAVLVMDVQAGILARLPEPDAFVDRVADLLDQARGAGAHVGYVRVAFTAQDYAAVPAHSSFHAIVADPDRTAAMAEDAATTAIDPRVAPRPGDLVVRKTRIGPFSTTDLREQLEGRGVDTLVLAGISTSGVVLSTVRQAADLDYRVVVVADAVADTDPEVHRVLLGTVFPRQGDVVTTADLGAAWA